MDQPAPLPATLKIRLSLAALLIGSWAIRAFLSFRGGQAFFPDEQRYFRSWSLLSHLLRLHWGRALDVATSSPDHTGFVFVGLIPCLAQFLYRGPHVYSALALGASILALSSVAVVFFTYLACRRAGGSPAEALAAALLVSTAASMTYYARHLVPYDSALALGLAALCLGLRVPAPPAVSLACGLVSSLAFLTYNGAWSVALLAVLTHVIWGEAAGLERVRRGALAALGGLVPLGALAGLASIRGTSYVRGVLAFSHTISQCDFAEGLTTPWAFLWSAEGCVFVLLAVSGLAGFWIWLRFRPQAEPRGALWLFLVLGLYGILAVGSALHVFCVYARISRQLVPFLSLLAAWALFRLPLRFQRLFPVGLVLILCHAAYNLRTPLAQQFPRDIEREVAADFYSVGHDTTLIGPYRGRHRGRRWILLNTRFLAPIQGTKAAPRGVVVFRIPHPFHYTPYQYEVLSGAERAILRSTDASMRLIDRRPHSAAGGQEPGP